MMYEIYADGDWWTGPDGETEWTHYEAIALCESLEARGYVNVMPVRM